MTEDHTTGHDVCVPQQQICSIASVQLCLSAVWCRAGRVQSVYLSFVGLKQLPAATGNNKGESTETEPKLWVVNNQNNQFKEAKKKNPQS